MIASATKSLSTESLIDSDVLFFLLREVLLTLSGSNGDEFCVIDPVIITFLIDSPQNNRKKRQSDENTLKECKIEFEQAQSRDLTLLLPLHCSNHWSLMIYKPSWRQWYACDSAGAYHSQRQLACLDALDRLGLVSPVDRNIMIYTYLPRQPASYECGRYVLFYAFVVISNMKACGEQTIFDTGLEQQLQLVNETNRVKFESFILKALEKWK